MICVSRIWTYVRTSLIASLRGSYCGAPAGTPSPLRMVAVSVWRKESMIHCRGRSSMSHQWRSWPIFPCRLAIRLIVVGNSWTMSCHSVCASWSTVMCVSS